MREATGASRFAAESSAGFDVVDSTRDVVVGRDEEVPITSVAAVSRVREEWLSVLCGPADVVQMQMGEHHVCHVLGVTPLDSRDERKPPPSQG